MAAPAAAAIAAVFAFVATQLDELIILAQFFAASAPGSTLTPADVYAGYLAASVVVLSASATGAAAAAAPPAADRSIRLLGLVPLWLGLKTLAKRLRRRLSWCRSATPTPSPDAAPVSAETGAASDQPEAPEQPAEEQPKAAAGMCTQLLRPGVALVFASSLATGSEEVAAFLPLFATRARDRLAATAAVLTALSAAWAFLAHALARSPPAARLFERYGEAAEPWLLVAVGVYCLVGSWIIPVEPPWS
jgi:cadmium resistance protein CadD (predicted permease)